ncbi:MarR family winged helix-turn-helix transcriptional regulator [Streptomyces sp. NPDC014006]|uniref:MarR family winged helix-turn-helix transcriptional regulator n=1 Tax=Streptomyces sp. NPDC014006 TaxID=3364870 RepID=UPI0036FA68EF
MTRLGSPGGDETRGSRDGVEAVAVEIADAVDSLTSLWSVAAQEAALRLSLHQLRALRALEAAPDVNLTALAEQLGIGPPTASRLCDRLEAAGLLQRSPHPHKRREVQLRLTGHGNRVLKDVAARRAQALGAALASMAPEERSALSRGLRAYLAARETGAPPPAQR